MQVFVPQSLASVLLAIAITTAATAATISQNFTSDPNWTKVKNNTANGGNSSLANYDFSAATSNAGGATGEVGGFYGHANFEHYYADTVGIANQLALTLNDTIHADGKLFVDSYDTNGEAQLGHRSSSTSDPSFIGIRVFESGTTGSNVFRAYAYIQFSDGTIRAAGIPELQGPSSSQLSGGVYTWNYDYDPNIGNGRLTGFVSNGTILTWTQLDLTPAERAKAIALNAFGIGGRNTGLTSPANNSAVFIDDVTYTAFPEPSSLALLALAGAWLARRSA